MGEGIVAAGALRPRPTVLSVLTDGFTPWPEEPPRGIRVIVGLLTEGPRARAWSPPDAPLGLGFRSRPSRRIAWRAPRVGPQCQLQSGGLTPCTPYVARSTVREPTPW
jgi:hypothetical protein